MKNRFKKSIPHSVLLAISIASLFFPPKIIAQEWPLAVEKALISIQPDDVYEFIRVLASPRFSGRLTGDEGYSAAARWVAELFHQWGLKPINPRDGYLQSYPSPYVIVDRAEMTLYLKETSASSAETGLITRKLEPVKDFLPLLFSSSGQASGELVFCGWAISAPELGYDDYAGMDVRGKFVLCFRGTPDERDRRFEPHDQHRERMKTARDKGAIGLIYIYPEPLANPNGDWIDGFFPAMVSEAVADSLLKEKGLTASELRRDLQTYRKPLSFSLSSRLELTVEARNFPQGTGYNVVGLLEGTDPRLKKECLVIGAHLDHAGYQMGVLFPGANDNASGSAVVMATAQAFSRLKEKPRRSILFVLFGGEEKGLQGSNYFLEHFPLPSLSPGAMFNFDMVGEGDGLNCSLGPDDPVLRQFLEEADKKVKILRRIGVIRGVGVRGSDYAPFFLKGIPCVSYSSNGPHLAYHLPGDTIYRVNPEIMADSARLAFLSAYLWANR